MSSRATQTNKSAAATATSGGAGRVTQAGKVGIVDMGTPRGGGAAHTTQVTRIVIGTRQLLGGGLLLRGLGS